MRVSLLGLVVFLGACAACQPAGVAVAENRLVAMASRPVSSSGLQGAAYQSAVGGYLQGAVADVLGENDVAADRYLNTLGEDPDNLLLRQRVFGMSLLNGDVPTAVRLAKTLPEGLDMKDAGGTGGTMPQLVRMADALAAGRIADARKNLREAAKVAPSFVQFKLLEAYMDVASGASTTKVVESLMKEKMPQAMAARRDYHIARLWLKAGEQDKALDALRSAQKAEPGALFTVVMLANQLERRGHLDEARAVNAAFRSANPTVALMVDADEKMAARAKAGTLPEPIATTVTNDVAVTLFDFGLMVWSQGADVPARQLMNLAIWLAPEDNLLAYYGAIVDEFAGEMDRAQTKLVMLQDDPLVGLASRLRLAEIAFKEGHRKEATATMRKLVKANPEVAAMRRSLAEMAFDAKDYEMAAKEYTALVDQLASQQSDLTETDADVLAGLYFAQGAAFERLRKYDDAARAMQNSLNINPANPQVLNYLGYMWIDQDKNIEAAHAMLLQALRLAPDDGAITDSVGWAYFKTKDYPKAILYLERAVELVPDDATVTDHLGDAYAAVGRTEEAKVQWRRALQLAEEPDAMTDEGFADTVKKKLK